MGTASFSVMHKSGSVASTAVGASGTLVTTGTPANAQSGGQDIILSAGEIFQVHVTTDTRINFGGNAAASTAGHFLAAGTQFEYQATDTGTISMIEA